jgi:putative intracellular protease/amidase
VGADPSLTAVHLLVFDGFADWEPAYALAELRRSGGIPVTTVGFSGAPVRSMGGLAVAADLAVEDVDPASVRLLLLPGGDLWEGSYPRAGLDSLLRELVARRIPIAAICGATLALARAGLLNERSHTSNEPAYLQQAAEYRGASGYVDALAVRDRGVITASGVGPVEFAREIFEELEVFSRADRSVWYHLFKHGRFPEPASRSQEVP